MRVPTTIPALLEDPNQTTATKLFADLDLTHLSQDIALSSWIPPTDCHNHLTNAETNPLRRALREALQSLPPNTLESTSHTIDTLVSSCPESYSVYKPLLLLPSTSPSSPWATFISAHASALEPVWSHIASAFSCTHIALNSPIPPSNPSSSAHSSDKDNILRSPVHLTPLHGSFGPSPTSQTLSTPTEQDFRDALWVQTTQNGIKQTWAPLYTMFSRGNVKEKARVLKFASSERDAVGPGPLESASRVSSAVEQGDRVSATSAPVATAVDMYAGIGYFAFSYRRAGTALVLCFELNPWSVEGLRRGAALNGWRARVFTADRLPAQDACVSEWEAWRDGAEGAEGAEGVTEGGLDFLIFAMSNSYADAVLRCLRDHVPPTTHVNLGLLPVSRPSWPSAVRAIDVKRGGWVHAHENVGVVEIDERRAEVEAEFQRLVDESGAEGRREVKVEHVEKVKMYAPGVVHAVFDVYVSGTLSSSSDTHQSGSTCK
ncbi:S-adenosylmethionine-dependent methyltransferase [Didymella sp. IMI 355093]|nr:S-adenosylmethionine-dependent methyltransferase [Didymella sp. IMI 355093]